MLEEEIFTQTIALPPEERAAFLREACGDDEALRKGLEELIVIHEKGRPLFGSFGDEPLLEIRHQELQEEREALDILSVGNILEVKLTGKLTKHAYETFAPEVTRLILEHGKLCILFQIHDFHGWTAGAIWEDIKFDFEHWKDIDRLAIVGEAKW